MVSFKEMRVRAGKTVLEAARALNVSPQAVYRWEDGTYPPSTKRLLEIAALYDCKVDDLLKEEQGGE